MLVILATKDALMTVLLSGTSLGTTLPICKFLSYLKYYVVCTYLNVNGKKYFKNIQIT